MNLILNMSICGALILVTLAVGLYRKRLENQCDNYLHLHNDSHDATLVTTQAAVCKRLEAVGKTRTALIVAVILYILAIAVFAVYTAWNNQGT